MVSESGSVGHTVIVKPVDMTVFQKMIVDTNPREDLWTVVM